jgi:hypothetical protein
MGVRPRQRRIGDAWLRDLDSFVVPVDDPVFGGVDPQVSIPLFSAVTPRR